MEELNKIKKRFNETLIRRGAGEDLQELASFTIELAFRCGEEAGVKLAQKIYEH